MYIYIAYIFIYNASYILGFSPEFLSLAREIRYSPDKRELYRRVIGHLQQRLLSTIRWCEMELKQTAFDPTSLASLMAISQSHAATDLHFHDAINSNTNNGNIEQNPSDYIPKLKSSSDPIFDTNEVLEPLKIMHR